MKRNRTNGLGDISERQQQYLETIYELLRDQKRVGTKAVADRLGVKMPSVTEAVRRMAAAGFVKRDAGGRIALTALGRRHAEALENRHVVLRMFMKDVLGMESAIAEQEACSIEHATRGAFVSRLAELMEALSDGQLKKCREALTKWKEAQSS